VQTGCPGRSSRAASARSMSDGAMAKTAIYNTESLCQLTCLAPVGRASLPAVLGGKKQTWQAVTAVQCGVDDVCCGNSRMSGSSGARLATVHTVPRYRGT
jgi:hypothetical protein